MKESKKLIETFMKNTLSENRISKNEELIYQVLYWNYFENMTKRQKKKKNRKKTMKE
jgi:hypothetical protein